MSQRVVAATKRRPTCSFAPPFMLDAPQLTCIPTYGELRRAAMASDNNADASMQLGHVLFLDIVAYSKLLTNEQRELLKDLNQIVRGTEAFRTAESLGELVRLPTGDGMALAFFNSPEAPVRCAVQIAQGLKHEPRLQVRMGINSGPVDEIEDVNERANVAGAGINYAQRVMDCGDGGHILLAKRVADDLAQYAQWKAYLHDIGEAEVKHGATVPLVNFYSDEVGNPRLPSKLQRRKEELAGAQRRKVGIALLALLLTAAVAGWFFFLRAHATIIPFATNSIAVLPFVNLSADMENAFFADGMQDEVLTDLARVADLKVISRSSVMQYKDAPARNLRQIAQQLGVAYLLEGSVQRAANKVRVITQLIDARTDTHIWAKTFDRALDDVFAVQSEIAETIAEQLRVQISPEVKAAIEEKPTNDMVAYDLYLQARQLLHNISASKDWEGDTNKAINYLDRAVERDSQFGLAFGLLTELNLNLYNYTDHSGPRQQRAKTALDQAMRFAPEAAETYVARSFYYMSVDHDYDAALETMRNASRLIPNDSDMLSRLASAEGRRAEWAEAVRNLERAKVLDPRGPNVPNHLQSLYLGLREYAKCDQVADDAIKAFPNAPGYFLLAKVESARARGNPKLARERLAAIPSEWDPSSVRSFAAIAIEVADRNYDGAKRLFAAFDRSKLIEAMSPDFALLEALVAQKQGDSAKVESILLPLREAKTKELSEHPNESIVFEELAQIDAFLGRKEEAVREAEKAVELRPISRDATAGPDRVQYLALVCAMTGDHDRAIQLLQQVAAIPYGPSYGQLLRPEWDDLRGDPRFEQIIALLKPKE